MTGIELIGEERIRQIRQEGWTPAHDDGHVQGELAVSAARYALEDVTVEGKADLVWPFESCWFKPKDPIRNLVRAGALIAAEIDRRLREKP